MRFKRHELAARLGVEPRQNESESFVLPLHHRAEIIWSRAVTNPRPGLNRGARLNSRAVADSQVGCRPEAPPGTNAGRTPSRRAQPGAGDWIRTRNRLFTKQVLYR